MGSKSFSLGEELGHNPSISFNRDNSEISKIVTDFDYENTETPKNKTETQETPEVWESEAPKMNMR